MSFTTIPAHGAGEMAQWLGALAVLVEAWFSTLAMVPNSSF